MKAVRRKRHFSRLARDGVAGHLKSEVICFLSCLPNREANAIGQERPALVTPIEGRAGKKLSRDHHLARPSGPRMLAGWLGV
jgi:hypothetical protein